MLVNNVFSKLCGHVPPVEIASRPTGCPALDPSDTYQALGKCGSLSSSVAPYKLGDSASRSPSPATDMVPFHTCSLSQLLLPLTGAKPVVTLEIPTQTLPSAPSALSAQKRGPLGTPGYEHTRPRGTYHGGGTRSDLRVPVSLCCSSAASCFARLCAAQTCTDGAKIACV